MLLQQFTFFGTFARDEKTLPEEGMKSTSSCHQLSGLRLRRDRKPPAQIVNMWLIEP